MRKRIDIDALPYALGAILLGMVRLAVHDFALQWQPVPQWVPARAPSPLSVPQFSLWEDSSRYDAAPVGRD